MEKKEISEKEEMKEKEPETQSNQKLYLLIRKQAKRISELEKELERVKFFVNYTPIENFPFGMDNSDCFKRYLNTYTIYFRAILNEGLESLVLFDIETDNFAEERDMVMYIGDLGDWITDPVKFCEFKGIPNIIDGKNKLIDPVVRKNSLKSLKMKEYRGEFTKEDYKHWFGMYEKRITKRSEISYDDENRMPSESGQMNQRILPIEFRKRSDI